MGTSLSIPQSSFVHVQVGKDTLCFPPVHKKKPPVVCLAFSLTVPWRSDASSFFSWLHSLLCVCVHLPRRRLLADLGVLLYKPCQAPCIPLISGRAVGQILGRIVGCNSPPNFGTSCLVALHRFPSTPGPSHPQ